MCATRLVGLLAGAALPLAATSALVVGQTTTRVSVSSAGKEGNGISRLAAVSADGRNVVFSSEATNLVAGDTNAREDVFIHDRLAATTVRVSVDSAGNEGNSYAVEGAVSADGRYVAFSSVATNLVPGDNNATQDIFVHDRDADGDGVFDENEPGAIKTVRVSISSAGAEGNGYSEWPSMSADGRYVAFDSAASNLVAGDNNATYDVFVHDRDADADGIFDEPGAVATVRVSISSAGVETNDTSGGPSISPDGRYVAFASRASNLVAGDINGKNDVFVHDRDADGDGVFDEPAGITTVRVSISSGGAEGDGNSWLHGFAANARFVAFATDATNLVPGDTNGRRDVLVHDRDADNNGVFDEPGGVETARVSVHSDGSEANDASFWSKDAISQAGRYVVFGSQASNLVDGDTNGLPDIFVHDRQTGQTLRASVDSDGAEGNGISSYPMLSLDGGVVAFGSSASNLVPDDDNLAYDVFVRVFDADGDGLWDSWETDGIDVDSDGVTDLDLAALGADPQHKDLFVEVDAMVGRAPAQAAIDMLVAAFANAPVDNPDPNDPGITLHIQLDETDIPLADWPNDWADFDAVKVIRFGTPGERADPNWANIRVAKSLAFRYCVFADTYGAGTSSGLAEGPGNDFMVTLGNFAVPGGTVQQQAGTFMHELGHNLGLYHGGDQHDANWPPRYNFKPNYTSVMNYTWQFPMAGYAAGWQLDYSRQALEELNENCLNEADPDGIGGRVGVFVPAVIGNQLCGAQLVPENGPINWDGDPNPGEPCVPNDINALADLDRDNICDVSPGNVLSGHDDWSNLRYAFGGHPDFADGVHISSTLDDEMTAEVFEQLNRIGCAEADFDCDGDVDLDDFGSFAACYNGANNPPAPSCPAGVDADLDNDGDVDLDDFSIFAANYTGSL